MTEFVTLDRVTEAPGGEATDPHTGWVGEYHDRFRLAETKAFDSGVVVNVYERPG